MTMFAELNGQRIVSGSLIIPYYGCWAGDAVLATALTTTDPLAITIGNLTMKGHDYRSAGFAGSKSVRYVGGYGGWRKAVPSQSYYNPNGVAASVIIGDVAHTVGEQYKLTSDYTVGSYFIRENAEAQRTLNQLTNGVWWMGLDGVTNVGPRTVKTPITSAFTVNAWSGDKGRFEISTEDLASWMPGRTFVSANVPTPQAISLTTIEMDNAGKLRLIVLTAGNADE